MTNHANLCDHTHASTLQSWVQSANTAHTEFPIQNLPFGRFRLSATEAWRVGVAIGDQVLDLAATGLMDSPNMADVLALPAPKRRALRHAISAGLAAGSAQQGAWRAHLHAQADVQWGLPCEVRDYSDFYIGIHHATAVGKLFRPDQPLLPNYKHVPIGYHGRASSLIPSGQGFHRPLGQSKAPDAVVPSFGACQRLDFELELGIVLGGAGNALGQRIPIEQAEAHVFGMCLLNDWSARDIQAWEYQPLGPFLSKSFASTLSPWLVTMEALAPYRQAFVRDAADPQPLPYLSSEANSAHGALDIQLEVCLQTDNMRQAGLPAQRISQSNFAQAAYWTLAQMVTHHSVNGCNLSAGDLFGSGTMSGPAAGQEGSLLEMTAGGKTPITLPNGEERRFLQDGDEITLRAHCQREGFARIGFGECRARVLPANLPAHA